jgi:ligand-binding sensor domain-containing protein
MRLKLPRSRGCSWRVGLALLLLASIAQSEQLPIKHYTTADGLAQNAVNRIVRDSRGFLWFCTDEGLSRFDGYTFTNYTTAQGLSHSVIHDLLETRSGSYWVGADVGLYRFNPRGRPPSGAEPNKRLTSDDPMFVLYHPNDHSTTGGVNALLEDHAGAVWCGTGQGLYRLEPKDGGWTLRAVEIGLPREVENDMRVRALSEDRQGALWIGAGAGFTGAGPTAARSATPPNRVCRATMFWRCWWAPMDCYGSGCEKV